MSRKAVSRALEALREGDTPASDEILRHLTSQFIRKELTRRMRSEDPDSALAERLWRLRFESCPAVRTGADTQALRPAIRAQRPADADATPDSPDVEPPPSAVGLDDPAPLFDWLHRNHSRVLSFARVSKFEVWGIVATSALARAELNDRLTLTDYAVSAAGRFAHAIGVSDLVRGVAPAAPGEAGRTAKLRRVTAFAEIEAAASEVSTLLVRSDEGRDTRLTMKYVIVELLRNVIQHSHDRLGGVVAAQRMDNRDGQSLQVAVADTGVGIFDAMIEKHSELRDNREALEKALWPRISGTFVEGLSGSQQNAGLGLFFISEMAKLTGGRLLLASRDAALLLTADPEAGDNHDLRFLKPDGLGYPGTLVAFELPVESVGNYDDLIETIQKRARERTPKRARHHWIRYEESPSDAAIFVVRCASENTERAEKLAREQLEPRILRKEPIVLDFGGMDIVTQSYLHALLFSALRLAWARQSFIYVVNASSSVRSGIELVEDYALGG